MSKKENKKIVDINLSLNEVDNTVMSDLHKDMLKEELSKLPPLKLNEVSIDGIYTYDMGDKLEVNVYIRNGLTKQISLEKIPLVIQNGNGDILAREIIDMKDLGIIKPMGGRPYKVYFRKENMVVDKIPTDDWEIKFENQIQSDKMVNVELEGLSENISKDVLKEIRDYMKAIPLVKKGDVNIRAMKMNKNKDNSISIILLIRNGLEKQIKTNRIPIKIVDEEENFVGGGVFDIENIEVNPYKARVYNFILKPEKIVNNNVDLSNCTVYFAK